jgi:dUTPase
MVWKPGGCSHIDTYDPKPEATSDYRGPLGVALINLGLEDFTIHHGDRIAQAVIAPVLQVRFAVVEELILRPQLGDL